jgi:ubiquitin-protein ligase
MLGIMTPNFHLSSGTQNQASQRDFQLCSFFRGIAFIIYGSDQPDLLVLMNASLLAQAIEELLRNDSISDCSERAQMYVSFFSALQAIATNRHLVGFYTSERDGVEKTDGLERIIGGHGQVGQQTNANESGWERRGQSRCGGGDKSPSLLQLTDTLVTQADTFCKTAGKISGGLNIADANVSTSLQLCKVIIDVQHNMQSTASHAFQQGTVTAPVQKELSGTEAYRLACSKLAYDEIPTYATDARFGYQQLASAAVSVNPRRTITLAKELSTMATSLPPGIFVRNIPNRPDCIKVLIIGPSDTPYYGGMWEFDIWATANYPAEAPLVHLNTTANGHVRFNPNLYAYIPQMFNFRNGKVCLSLIGTWPGSPEEQWQPYKSTIMQILISIQSMLLCARPYFNEPGMGRPMDNSGSLAYDREIRLQTVRVAMCDWLVPEKRTSMWKVSYRVLLMVGCD